MTARYGHAKGCICGICRGRAALAAAALIGGGVSRHGGNCSCRYCTTPVAPPADDDKELS